MSSRSRPTIDESSGLTDELQKLASEYGWGAVEKAIADLRSRPPGRPTGWSIDDWAALANMDQLLDQGQAETVTVAARQSLHLTEAHSEESAVRRLRDKYKKHRGEISLYRDKMALRVLSNIFKALEVKIERDAQAVSQATTRTIKRATEELARMAEVPTLQMEAVADLEKWLRQLTEINIPSFSPEENPED